MNTRNCPKCGDDVGPQLASTRMTNCPSCGTSLFLLDDRFALAGDQGVLHDAPMLITLASRILIHRRPWHILGQVRFSYGRGFWDEFWAKAEDGTLAWISVDEGDIVLQTALPLSAHPALTSPPPLGETFLCQGKLYRVTETETAVCQAFRGTLPERFAPGDTHHFLNAQGEDASLLSGEFWSGQAAWYLGRWIDPFDITTVSPT